MTNSTKNPISAFPDSKSHYEILDGLRGVAAIMIVMFHICETFTGGNHLIQVMNHGYLAVDFFFLLSGYVIGYAYDDRWGKMTLRDFFKRRIIRLHPLVIWGMILGAIGFYFSASPNTFHLVSEVPVWEMLLVMLIGFTLIPITPSMDIRGWSEMHPLDGTAWSLFFEYIANILYALFVRKFSNKLLALLVFIAGCALIHLTVTSPTGDVVGGWSVDPTQLRIGFTRLMYPFFAGLLLSRVVKPTHINNAFLWCSLAVIVILSFPRIGGADHLWMNGLFESFTIIFLFPLIVYMGASGELKGKFSSRTCKFLGDISYPIYITHYPIIYIFTAWVDTNQIKLVDSWPVSLFALISSIAVAYLSLKLYDVPVRNWLTKKYIKKTVK